MNRPTWMPAPDYRRLLTSLRHEEPDRVPLAELAAEPPLKARLLGRRGKDQGDVSLAEVYRRRAEDKFIWWEEGGRVLEQTGYVPSIGFTGGGVAQAFGRAFEATGNPIYLAKALTLARPLMEEFTAHSGKYAWDHYSAPRAAINLLEMYRFLKEHNLPGSE